MINTNGNFVNNIDLNEGNSLPHLIEQMDPNCIQETWANNETKINYFHLQNYTMVNDDSRLSINMVD